MVHNARGGWTEAPNPNQRPREAPPAYSAVADSQTVTQAVDESTPLLKVRSDTGPVAIIRRHRKLFALGLAVALGAFVLGYLVNGTVHEAIWDLRQKEWEAGESHRADILHRFHVQFKQHEARRAEMAKEALEMDARRAQWDEERRRWREEDRARQEKERKRREEAERQRALITWEDFRTERCTRYGTREYSARLTHVPRMFDPFQECKNHTLRIHGRDVLPHCSADGMCGDPIGHWEVDFEEPGCRPTWSRMTKKECGRRGFRNWDAALNGVEENNWMAVCVSTPASFEGHEQTPDRCESFFWSGKWGFWEVQDSSC